MTKTAITLLTGYTDPTGVNHREVAFGTRLKVRDLLALDLDPQARIPTQYADLIRRKMIVRFGEINMPVPLTVLLGLDAVDREDIASAADEFLLLSRNGRQGEFADEDTVKLIFGFEVDGTNYTTAKFGKLLTGADEVEADKRSLAGVAREIFMIGRQIVQLQSENGEAVIDGPIDPKQFEHLDGEDLNLLRVGAALSRASFRVRREEIQRSRQSEECAAAG